MKDWIRRLSALLMGMMMLLGTALADTAGLDWATNGYWEVEGDVQFDATAQITSLTPYGDGTLEMLNALLKQMNVSARLSDGGADAEWSVHVGGENVASISETQTQDGTQLTTSLLPNRKLISRGSAMDAFSGFEQEEAQFDLFTAIRETEECYQELAEAIIPFAEEKEANYNIKGVGSCRWVRLARMTPEQSAQIQPQIAKVLACGMDEAFREQLNGMTCQKSFVVALYRTKKEGKDLAVYIKGNVTFPDGAQRAINYQWAFAQNDKGQRVDTYKFDMTKTNTPRDNRQISASYKRSADAQTLLVDGQSKAAIRDPETGVTTTTTITHDLSGKGGKMEGSVSHAVRTALGEEASTTTLTITPSLQLTQVEEGAVVNGSAHVEQATGKTVHISLDVLFDEQTVEAAQEEADDGVMFIVIDERLPQSSLTQNLILPQEKEEPESYLVGKPPIGYTGYSVPEAETTVDLDTISQEARAALMDELTQRLAGGLLKAITKLPDEATALIRDNLSEADYAAFLDLLEE